MTPAAKSSALAKPGSQRRRCAGTLKIGHVELGNIPRVVLAVSRDTTGLRDALATGVDILELRVDQLQPAGSADLVAQVMSLKRYGVPIIGTVRSVREGGASALSSARRATLYAALSPLVDAVDVEVNSAPSLASTLRLARENGNLIILSYHHFSKTPALGKLEEVLAAAVSHDADVTKIATQARTPADVIRLFRFTEEHRSRHLVTMAMGAMGSVSRLLLPLAGSLLTYTNVTPSHGQIPVTRLIDDLRFYYPAYDADIVTRRQSGGARYSPGAARRR
jgi:3-dehydroquinate dehydratase-1